MRTIGEHAVVLGAGMAGLLAARVLSDAYEQGHGHRARPASADAEHRRGVPQGRHAHLLIPCGTQVLDELFKGLVRRPVGGRRTGGSWTSRSSGSRPAVGRRCGCGGRLEIRSSARPAGRAWRSTSAPGSARCPTSTLIDRCDAVGVTTERRRRPRHRRTRAAPRPRRCRRSPSTPTSWWTRPAAAAGHRPGSRRSATTSRARTSSRSTWRTPPGTFDCVPAPWRRRWSASVPSRTGPPDWSCSPRRTTGGS